MDDLTITHLENPHGGAFHLTVAGRRLGEMTYETSATAPQHITILHTEVSPELRGRGAAQKLVEAGVAWARAHGVKVVPQCPYAKQLFAKHAELRDVLASS